MKNASPAARLFGHSYATRLAEINSIFRHLVLFPHFPMEWRKLILIYVQIQQPSATNKRITSSLSNPNFHRCGILPYAHRSGDMSIYHISELTNFLDSWVIHSPILCGIYSISLEQMYSHPTIKSSPSSHHELTCIKVPLSIGIMSFVLLDTVPEHVTTSQLTSPRSVSWIHCNMVQWNEINLVDNPVLGCCCRADDDHSRSKPVHPFYTR